MQNNIEKRFKKVRFGCGGGNVKLSNNEALNLIVNHLGIKH